MQSLYEYLLEGAGHAKMRLGAGSTGTVYDLGNGKLRKTLRVKKDSVSTNAFGRQVGSPRHNDALAIERWAKVKKGLKVIPYIEDVDYDGYTIEKFKTPCVEGKWISQAIHILCTSDPKSWTNERIETLESKLGKKNAQWVLDWLRDFHDDYVLIMGPDARISDDIRETNIGKDKNGRVVIFDWFDPYCF